MKWLSSDGTSQEISEMQDNHLFYALRKVMQRNGSARYDSKTWTVTDTRYYDAMCRELISRGFDKPVRLDEKWNEMIVRVAKNDINSRLTPEQEKWIEDQFTF